MMTLVLISTLVIAVGATAVGGFVFWREVVREMKEEPKLVGIVNRQRLIVSLQKPAPALSEHKKLEPIPLQIESQQPYARYACV
jgi:hypothetical protein